MFAGQSNATAARCTLKPTLTTAKHTTYAVGARASCHSGAWDQPLALLARCLRRIRRHCSCGFLKRIWRQRSFAFESLRFVGGRDECSVGGEGDGLGAAVAVSVNGWCVGGGGGGGGGGDTVDGGGGVHGCGDGSDDGRVEGCEHVRAAWDWEARARAVCWVVDVGCRRRAGGGKTSQEVLGTLVGTRASTWASRDS